MILIACIDDEGGMLFNHRRQSRDKTLVGRIVELARGKRLYMNSYSAKLFADYADSITVDEQFLTLAAQGDYCFVENTAFADRTLSIEQMIIYKWNKRYPYDVRMPLDLLQGFRLVASTDFVGNAHDKITEERYVNEAQ